VKWWETLMVRHVETLPSLPASVPVPELPRRVQPWAVVSSPFDTYTYRGPEPHDWHSEPDDTVTRYLWDLLGAEYGRVVYEWFRVRRDWPLYHLDRAFTAENDAIHARSACRAAALARARLEAQLEGSAAERIAVDLLPGRARPAQRLEWLGMPQRLACDCAPPAHVRGIARCEWNEVRGWRPREDERPVGNG
jgi:hypothetical protein